jgi:hypothetical protein
LPWLMRWGEKKEIVRLLDGLGISARVGASVGAEIELSKSFFFILFPNIFISEIVC